LRTIGQSQVISQADRLLNNISKKIRRFFWRSNRGHNQMMEKKIFVASDHAGFALKSYLLNTIAEPELISPAARDIFISTTAIDCGPFNSGSVDYPDFADLAIRKMMLESLATASTTQMTPSKTSPEQVTKDPLGEVQPAKVFNPSLKTVVSTSAAEPAAFAILICGSGQGMAMRANRYSGVRAALCWNEEIAKLSREHNNANVLALGSRFLTNEQALKIVSVFLKTEFSGGRHTARVAKIEAPC
jgi:RpiB/LacA/LacB family sugar-phosphate isomerase